MRVYSMFILGAILQPASAQLSSSISAPAVRVASFPSPGRLPNSAIVREIDDPNSGVRWLLFRDPDHLGGPGRLVEVSSSQLRGPILPSPASDKPRSVSQPQMIRAGDRVVLEEETPVVEAHLEAVALGPANSGSPLRVRLRIGGRVVEAIAAGPGRVALARPAEPEP